jgi:hypothetical protein
LYGIKGRGGGGVVISIDKRQQDIPVLQSGRSLDNISGDDLNVSRPEIPTRRSLV